MGGSLRTAATISAEKTTPMVTTQATNAVKPIALFTNSTTNIANRNASMTDNNKRAFFLFITLLVWVLVVSFWADAWLCAEPQ